MKLTNREKDILNLALTTLNEYYDEREKTCRELNLVPDKEAIEDIKKAKEEGRQTIMKLINGL